MTGCLTRRGSAPERGARLGCAFLLLLLTLLPAGAEQRQALPGGHVPLAVGRLSPIGTVPGAKRLNLAFGLPLRNQAELDSLLQQLYDPASPNYHRYLTPEEFTARFGPTEADYQGLIEFVGTNGLTVTRTYPNRVVLSVNGAVGDIERLLHVTLRVYPHPTEARTFYAPDAEPTVATTIPIQDISGLDDYSLPHPNSHLRPADLSGPIPKGGSGPGGGYIGSDFRNAYVPGAAQLKGAGQSVGLLQFDGFYPSDIATYKSQAGITNVIPLIVVPVDGGVGTPGSGVAEVSLDIEMVISMAPAISNVVLFEAPNPSPWVDLLNAMVDPTNYYIHQFSCSWGGGSVNATAEAIFKQMGTHGQSFFNATGDSDAFTGTIPFASDSTNITQVGGTTLTTGSSAAYSSETVWNWGLVANCSCYEGSSGGVSTYYRLPIYQVGISMTANLGSTTYRNVPDVALTGDNVYVVYSNGATGIFGGTSCAAPLWAGFTALVNQQGALAKVPSVGFLNPALYGIGKGANYSLGFHDTTTGNNFWPSSPSKYPAVAGYDLCTGWGTPNGTNLINLLVPAPVYAPLLVSNSFTLLAESCTNGAVDPGETVTVSFGLLNVGNVNTTNLVATLLATNGIVSPNGPMQYGVLMTNGLPVARAFAFTASGACGDTCVATLQLQDGATSLGTVTFSFLLGQPNVTTILSQNFDGVTAPALPAGWASSASGAQSAWVTSTANKDTAPNAAFAAEPSAVGLSELDSPAFALPAGAAQVSFRNRYNSQSGRDGGVLEIKIGSGAWTDITNAGGSFVSGGYNSTLSTSRSNPLPGRGAWSGNSSSFITTLANLPAAASGQTTQLRWRFGTDSSTSGSGWYVDTVSVTSSNNVCCSPSADLAVALTDSPDPVLTGQSLTYTLTVTNLGPVTASSVTLTDTLPASVIFVSASPGCVNVGGIVVATVGTLPNGGATNYSVLVTPTASGLLTNTLTAASPTADPNLANNTVAIVTTAHAAPAITAQPASQAVLPGTNATLQVAATGDAPLSYQWRFNGGNLAGALASTLTLTNVQQAQAGTYSVLVTNNYGSVVSSNAVLTVLDPWITSQPQSVTVAPGTAAAFTVGAVGTGPLAYQWFKDTVPLADGTNITGSQSATVHVLQVQLADLGNYSVTVSNLYGQVVSSNATLVSHFPAVISTPPASQTVPAGSVVSFTVEASGSSPISFQWQRGGTNLADGGKLSGSTTASLTVSNVQAADMGSYSVVVTNAYGGATSAPAALLVWPLAAWGRDDYGQTDIPGGLSNVTGIAAGFYHGLAVRADGTVAAWGAGTSNTGVSPNYGQALVPAGLSNVTALAGGAYHSLALRADGTVAAWGAGTNNTDVSPQYGQSLVPAGLSNVTAVAAGAYHSLALRADGTVAIWGDNTYGQTNVPAGLSGVVAIAAGAYHNLALRTDGTVVAWGAGTTNSGTQPQYGQSLVPAGLSNVVAVAAGWYHSLALKADGTVAAWGYNSSGQTNVPAGLTNTVALAAGYLHSVALQNDGTLVAWGSSAYGQTNNPAGLANVARVAAGGYHNLALQSSGGPTITVQPFSQTGLFGAPVQLLVLAAGAPPLAYQWHMNGSNLPGASLNSYTIPAMQLSNAGTYSVLVSNALGTALNANAVLSVPGPSMIASLTLQTNGSLVLNGSGFAGQTYVLLAASNVVPPLVWTPLQTNQAGSQGLFQFTDPGPATQARRFYRFSP
jgi:uncharacterized repeat protein (TIGR01451 family)